MRRSTVATGAILVITAIWGSTFFIIKDAVALIDPIDFLAVRFLIGALLPVAIFVPRLRALSWRQWGIGLGLGLLYGAAQIAQTIGLQWTAASVSGFITGTYVVITPLVVWVLFRTRPRAATWVAVGFALAGLALLSLTGLTGFGAGEGLTLLSAALYALHIVLLDRWATSMDSISLAVVQLVGVALICGGAALPDGITVPSDPIVWGAILYTAIAAGIVTMTLQSWAQRYLPATRVALMMVFEPVFATVFAMAFGGEALTGRLVLGGVMILIASVIGIRSGSESSDADRLATSLVDDE